MQGASGSVNWWRGKETGKVFDAAVQSKGNGTVPASTPAVNLDLYFELVSVVECCGHAS